MKMKMVMVMIMMLLINCAINLSVSVFNLSLKVKLCLPFLVKKKQQMLRILHFKLIYQIRRRIKCFLIQCVTNFYEVVKLVTKK